MTETGKRIVAGVDGSQSSIEALEWAVRQASLTGSVVDAVCAWQYPSSYGLVVPDEFDYAGEAAQTLAKAIADVSRQDGTVEIRSRLVERPAGQALTELAEGADLLVVGSRGHGELAGTLLGSVSQHCVHHAPCPVVVIRPHRR
jgi:nucleotide-binding universal stress UspA family protein